MYVFFLVCFLNKHTLLFDQIIPVLTALQTVGTTSQTFPRGVSCFHIKLCFGNTPFETFSNKSGAMQRNDG